MKTVFILSIGMFIGVVTMFLLPNNTTDQDPTTFHMQVEDDHIILTDHGKPVGIVERIPSELDSLLIDYLQ